MAPLPLPTSLSPSKVAAFAGCGQAFKFSAIDRVPEPPSPWTAKGTLVHLALEQTFGVLPARVELLHLREPLVLSSTPTERSRSGLRRRTSAMWSAIEEACATDGFLPRPGPRCSVCGYRDRCPAWAAPGRL